VNIAETQKLIYAAEFCGQGQKIGCHGNVPYGIKIITSYRSPTASFTNVNPENFAKIVPVFNVQITIGLTEIVKINIKLRNRGRT